MSKDSDRFRMRARQCRELAMRARDEHSREALDRMAIELDEEADAKGRDAKEEGHEVAVTMPHRHVRSNANLRLAQSIAQD